MDVHKQKVMAAKVMKCGIGRVWIDPTRHDDIADAITRSDIRIAVNSGVIAKKPEKGISTGRHKKARKQKLKGRRKGPGSRKGKKQARRPSKKSWMQNIRAIREELRNYRKDGVLDRKTYRYYYMQAKGGAFKSRAHLKTQMQLRGVFKEAKA